MWIFGYIRPEMRTHLSLIPLVWRLVLVTIEFKISSFTHSFKKCIDCIWFPSGNLYTNGLPVNNEFVFVFDLSH